MPYEIRHEDDGKWCVWNTATDKNKGCSDTEEMAKRHMAALYSAETKATSGSTYSFSACDNNTGLWDLSRGDEHLSFQVKLNESFDKDTGDFTEQMPASPVKSADSEQCAILSQGEVDWGAQCPDLHEFFLQGDWGGRLIFQMSGRTANRDKWPQADYEDAQGRVANTKRVIEQIEPPVLPVVSPREPAASSAWYAQRPQDQTPYVLSKEAVAEGWMPPRGESCLPRDMVDSIEPFWELDPGEAKKARDALVDTEKATTCSQCDAPATHIIDNEPFCAACGKAYMAEHPNAGSSPISEDDPILDKGVPPVKRSLLSRIIAAVRKAFDEPRDPDPESRPVLFTIKQVDGRYRWVDITSTAFLDQDEEIVSRSALEKVAQKASGDLGPLRFWHIDGLDVGACDTRLFDGVCLIESGLWQDDPLSTALRKAVEERPDDWAISCGFYSLQDEVPAEPINGVRVKRVFHEIDLVERSLLPREYSSNRFTCIHSRGAAPIDMTQGVIMDKAKRDLLVSLIGEDLTSQIATQADQLNDKATNDPAAVIKEVEPAPVATVVASVVAPVVVEPVATVPAATGSKDELLEVMKSVKAGLDALTQQLATLQAADAPRIVLQRPVVIDKDIDPVDIPDEPPRVAMSVLDGMIKNLLKVEA